MSDARPTSQVSLDVERITTAEGLRKLEIPWGSLWSRDPRNTLFSSADWFAVWWAHFGGASRPAVLRFHESEEPRGISATGSSLELLQVRAGARPIAIAPFLRFRARWRGFPAVVVAPALNPQSLRSGCVVAPGAEAALHCLVDSLLDEVHWDLLAIDGSPVASPFLAALEAGLKRRGLRAARRVRWSHSVLRLQGSWDGYLQQRGRHFRKHLFQARRALERIGELKVERYTGRKAEEVGLSLFLEVDGESWKAEEAEGESIARHSQLRLFYEDLVRRLACRDHCEIWILRIGGTPAAGYLCLCDGHRFYTYKTSYKTRFASSSRHSPGFVLMASVIEAAWKRGVAYVDFVGRFPFVDRWANGQEEYQALLVFNRGVYPRWIQGWDVALGRTLALRSSIRRLAAAMSRRIPLWHPRGEAR
jgi:CelD/BcsL family acetyltransferase involved in cellulose biosynthesis